MSYYVWKLEGVILMQICTITQILKSIKKFEYEGIKGSNIYCQNEQKRSIVNPFSLVSAIFNVNYQYSLTRERSIRYKDSNFYKSNF